MEADEKAKVLGCSLLVVFILLIPLMVLLNRGCNSVIDQIEDRSEEYTSYLGKKTAIDGDTLTITSYNLFKESFTLSNGLVIRYEVAKKYLIEE